MFLFLLVSLSARRYSLVGAPSCKKLESSLLDYARDIVLTMAPIVYLKWVFILVFVFGRGLGIEVSLPLGRNLFNGIYYSFW